MYGGVEQLDRIGIYPRHDEPRAIRASARRPDDRPGERERRRRIVASIASKSAGRASTGCRLTPDRAPVLARHNGAMAEEIGADFLSRNSTLPGDLWRAGICGLSGKTRFFAAGSFEGGRGTGPERLRFTQTHHQEHHGSNPSAPPGSRVREGEFRLPGVVRASLPQAP
jgi:hypothetical protein